MPAATPEPPPAPDLIDKGSTPIVEKTTYAQALDPRVGKESKDEWFRLKPIQLAVRSQKTYVNNTPVCFISSMELDQAAKQLEGALVLKFSSGRPSLQEIKQHVNTFWGLSKDPVISLMDARHVLMITASPNDMVRAQCQVSHKINSSLFRISRWHRKYDFSKDSTIVPVWVSMPKLPIEFMNPAILEKIGNVLGKFLCIDERNTKLTNSFRARICVEMDVTRELLTEIFIGDPNEEGYWQPLEYEGNLSFCSHCGLLGHTQGICRKMRTTHQNTATNNEKGLQKPIQLLRRPSTEKWQVKTHTNTIGQHQNKEDHMANIQHISEENLNGNKETLTSEDSAPNTNVNRYALLQETEENEITEVTDDKNEADISKHREKVNVDLSEELFQMAEVQPEGNSISAAQKQISENQELLDIMNNPSNMENNKSHNDIIDSNPTNNDIIEGSDIDLGFQSDGAGQIDESNMGVNLHLSAVNSDSESQKGRSKRKSKKKVIFDPSIKSPKPSKASTRHTPLNL
ncbi:hypothetical protein CASFOL_034832 [Castilleja foliolosa]|uniref:DUF4283 domain-containing protein n=1 Tax=Castilleja foliolosa TaxID=1961234 RepID=A0ABD3BQZ7_9LAMI